MRKIKTRLAAMIMFLSVVLLGICNLIDRLVPREKRLERNRASYERLASIRQSPQLLRALSGRLERFSYRLASVDKN